MPETAGKKSRAKAVIVSLPHDMPLQENVKKVGDWHRDGVPYAYLIESRPQTATKLAGLLSCLPIWFPFFEAFPIADSSFRQLLAPIWR